MFMNIDMADKNVLITGAATGIGKAMVKAFHQAGARVFINYFKQCERAEMLTQNMPNTHAYEADVSSKKAVETMTSAILEQWGAIDVLINNAGLSRPKDFLDVTEDDWDQTFNTNVKGAVFCCQAVLPSMLDQDEGVIINIASELGFLGRERFSAYTASKGALITLTRSLAREFAPAVRVNGIAPGPVMTDLLAGEINTKEDLENEQNNPLGRIAEPEEIAASAVFLASEHGKFYCGDILSPNGGVLMR